MNTPLWVLALFIVASTAQIVACITGLRRKSWWSLGFLLLFILTALGLYFTEERYGKRALDEKTVTLTAGVLDVDAFLQGLSLGEYKVVMDPTTAQEMKRRGIKIKTSITQDAPFTYVLEQVLLPQLPGPQQWEYNVIGKTIRVKRRQLL